VAVRLSNEKDPRHALSLALSAWWGILELALAYDWRPLGAALPGHVHVEVHMESYYPGSALEGWEAAHNGHSRLVLLEDALNLADALEQAFRQYEHPRLPASYFLFEPDDPNLCLRPGVGALLAVIDFCRSGAFWVQRQPVFFPASESPEAV
jgi:hypothetical protein